MINVKERFIENKNAVICLLVPIAVVAKLIEHLFLPEKYFYDSSRILLTSLVGNIEGYSWGGNYEFTAKIFAKLNVFNFTSLLQWSIAIGIIFNIILFIMFTRIKGMDLLQSIFTLMCIGLCNIYVFNLGKDIIQYFLFALCFIIISMDRIPIVIRALGVAMIFYWESTFFRNYYIIMAAFTLVVYGIFKIVRQRHIKINLKKFVLITIVLYVVMCVFLLIASVAMPEDYNDILNCKDSSTQLGASTVIDDKIEYGENIGLYMQNYIINSIRMMFPVELLSGGAFYFPFFLFQILLIYYMYRNIKEIHRVNDKNILALSTFIAFFMGSVLFEPDFGSFARHEAAAFPIIILFAIDNLNIIKGKVYEDDRDKRITYYGEDMFNEKHDKIGLL